MNWWILIVAVRFLRHWVMSTVVLFVRHKDANCRKVIWADDRLFTKQTRDKLSTLRIRVAVSFNMSKKIEHVSSLSTRRGSRNSVDEVLSDAYFTVHGTTYTTRRDATSADRLRRRIVGRRSVQFGSIFDTPAGSICDLWKLASQNLLLWSAVMSDRDLGKY